MFQTLLDDETRDIDEVTIVYLFGSILNRAEYALPSEVIHWLCMLIDLSFIIIMQDTIRVASGIISSNQEIESQVSKQANARDLFKNAKKIELTMELAS